MGEQVSNTESGLPNAYKFVNSLRNNNYSFESAIADLVDNSIEAESTKIDIFLNYKNNRVIVLDNGVGMDDSTHSEAMKIASETREYSGDDLGKYGVGMKLASLSQARKVTVASRAVGATSATAKSIDLDHIKTTNDWEKLILKSELLDMPPNVVDALSSGHGTAVIWENLDRAVGNNYPNPREAQEHMLELAEQVDQHLSMVFHRFLEGTAKNRLAVEMRINGTIILPWNPFCPSESTQDLGSTDIEFQGHNVTVSSYVLPSEKEFSSKTAFSNAGGVKRWLQSQGFYVYRHDRLIRWGGWLGLRSPDEHNKLARLALEFDSSLDEAFALHISKGEIVLPKAIKEKLQPVVREVSSFANRRYRGKTETAAKRIASLPNKRDSAKVAPSRIVRAETFIQLLAGVAGKNGLSTEMQKLKTAFIKEEPDISQAIGWTDER
jgi:hypothetical protein